LGYCTMLQVPWKQPIHFRGIACDWTRTLVSEALEILEVTYRTAVVGLIHPLRALLLLYSQPCLSLCSDSIASQEHGVTCGQSSLQRFGCFLFEVRARPSCSTRSPWHERAHLPAVSVCRPTESPCPLLSLPGSYAYSTVLRPFTSF